METRWSSNVEKHFRYVFFMNESDSNVAAVYKMVYNLHQVVRNKPVLIWLLSQKTQGPGTRMWRNIVNLSPENFWGSLLMKLNVETSVKFRPIHCFSEKMLSPQEGTGPPWVINSSSSVDLCFNFVYKKTFLSFSTNRFF